jgi:hypothetical protein
MVLGLADSALKPLNPAPLPPLNFVLPLARSRLLALSVQGVQRIDYRNSTPQ